MQRMLRKTLTVTAGLLIAASNLNAAQTISLNFAENTNQTFTGGQNIGPLATDSANWNSSIARDSGTLAAGTINDLIDGSGSSSGAAATWTSSNVWYNHIDNTSNDQNKLAVGYLDDGGSGVNVTITNIPYLNYRVIGLLSSDQDYTAAGPTAYTTRDFQVNGTWAFGGAAASTAPAYGNIADNNAANGSAWTRTTATGPRGNYFTTLASGSTLTLQGQAKSGTSRGSLAGVIIEDRPIESIGFNFIGNAGANGTLADTDIAGANGLKQQHWNNLATDWNGNSGAVPATVYDNAGNVVGMNNNLANGIRVLYDSNNTFGTNITADTPDKLLMKGYLDDNRPSSSQPYVQIENIPYAHYKIVVYIDGDQGSGGVDGAYLLEQATGDPNTDGADLTNPVYVKELGNFSGTWAQVPTSSNTIAGAVSGNYIIFDSLSASSVKIRVLEGASTPRGPINAFQIIAVPAPAALPAGMMLLGLLGVRRR